MLSFPPESPPALRFKCTDCNVCILSVGRDSPAEEFSCIFSHYSSLKSVLILRKAFSSRVLKMIFLPFLPAFPFPARPSYPPPALLVLYHVSSLVRQSLPSPSLAPFLSGSSFFSGMTGLSLTDAFCGPYPPADPSRIIFLQPLPTLSARTPFPLNDELTPVFFFDPCLHPSSFTRTFYAFYDTFFAGNCLRCRPPCVDVLLFSPLYRDPTILVPFPYFPPPPVCGVDSHI